MTATQGAGSRRRTRLTFAATFPFAFIVLGAALFVIGTAMGGRHTNERTTARSAATAPAAVLEQAAAQWQSARENDARISSPDAIAPTVPPVHSPDRGGTQGRPDSLAVADHTSRAHDSAFTATARVLLEPGEYEVVLEPWLVQAYGAAQFAELFGNHAVSER